MPGTKDFFQLEKYKFEVGKDYKRITFYLCPHSDVELQEGIEVSSDDSDGQTDTDFPMPEDFCDDNLTQSVPGTSQRDENVSQDEELARQLQQEWDKDPLPFNIPSISQAAQASDRAIPTNNLVTTFKMFTVLYPQR